jgi:cytolysin (calcineurin-like family phosphatase)
VGANGETPPAVALFPVEDDLTRAATGVVDLAPLDAEIDQSSLQSVARLISTFASEQVINQIPARIERVQNITTALSNNVNERCALEEQLKAHSNKASNPGVNLDVDINNTQVPLSIGIVVHCDAADLLSNLEHRLPPETWFFVVGRQQGAFDAVHVVSNTHIRFV